MWPLAATCAAVVSCFAQTGSIPSFGTTVVIPSGLRGLIYYIDRGTSVMPHFGELDPIGIIYTNGLNIPERAFDEGFPGVTNRVEWFAIDYSGRFWIASPGEYKFALTSDDGGKLYIDGRLAIDDDGIHLPQRRTASVELNTGVHRMRVSYYQGPRYILALILEVEAPKGHWRIFNTDEYKPPPDPDDWGSAQPRDPRMSQSGIPKTSFLAPSPARQAFLEGLSGLTYRRWKAAESSLRQALAIYPPFAQAWSVLGQTLEAESKLAEAREAYEKAVAIDPAYVRGLERLAKLDLTEERFDDAIAATDSAIAANPAGAPLAYYYRAAANTQLKRWKVVEEAARRAIEIDAAHEVPRAEFLLAEALQAEGNVPEALEHLKSYLKTSPPSADAKEARRLMAEWQRGATQK
jgi:tetratricopeptide (TPR) repeat protein